MSAKQNRLPLLIAGLLIPATALLSGADWPDWRGPARTGASAETGLASSWSPSGPNLAWKAPYGGRSGPVVFGDRLYLQNTSGEGAAMQERLMCFHADTGKLLWEHKYNLFTSDVPPHRIAWASPVVDPATGNVFAFSGNGLLMSLSRDGKLLWERSLAEEFGMWTTHGGRVSSPIVDGDQLIVSGLTFSWGQHAGGAHRFISLRQDHGPLRWVGSPEGRPTDTIYANPFVADVNGTRTMFSGGSDGAMHAMKIATGEPLWNWKVSQRGLNTAALVVGNDVIVTHSEENLGTSEMGMVAAMPAAQGHADRQGRALDGSRRAGGLRVSRLRRRAPLRRGQRRHPVRLRRQDGRAGLAAEPRHHPEVVAGAGRREAVRRHGERQVLHHRAAADGVDILDQDGLPGASSNPEPIVAAPAVARGRVYVVSMSAIYAIGPKMAPSGAPANPAAGAAKAAAALPAGVRPSAARHANRADSEAG